MLSLQNMYTKCIIPHLGLLYFCFIKGGPENCHHFLYALTLQNINRFSQLFQCQNQEKICNNSVIKDPIAPQMCRYTTL